MNALRIYINAAKFLVKALSLHLKCSPPESSAVLILKYDTGKLLANLLGTFII